MFIPKGFPVYFAHIQRFTEKTAGAFWPNMPSSVTNNNWRVLQRFDVDVDVDVDVVLAELELELDPDGAVTETVVEVVTGDVKEGRDPEWDG